MESVVLGQYQNRGYKLKLIGGSAMSEYINIVEKLREKGLQFSQGLTDSEIQQIETIYDIKFPKSLRNFYREGVPVSEAEYEFPRWSDFSADNISCIKKYWIEGPIDRLLPHIKREGYWIPEWGERPERAEDAAAEFAKTAQKAPKLIPVFGNKYLPILDGVDVPPCHFCR